MRTPTSVSWARSERPTPIASTITIAIVLLALVGCSAPATVYVVRHGEAWTNVPPPAGMKESDRDSLTPRGREQAMAAAKSLAGKGVKVILCSPKGRARETADEIQNQLRLEGGPTVLPALVQLAEGETPAEGQRRAVAALHAWSPDAPLVVVTHSDVAALLIGAAEGTPVEQCAEKHQVATGSVTRIELGE